jgi:hypothetical protein
VKAEGTERNSPEAIFLTGDGQLKSSRSLAGPLRLGTATGAGPAGALRDGTSDFGMDYVSPRRFDPLGTHDVRAPERGKSTLISREIRGSKK